MPLLLFERFGLEMIGGASELLWSLTGFGGRRIELIQVFPRMRWSLGGSWRQRAVCVARGSVLERSRVTHVGRSDERYYPFVITMPNWVRVNGLSAGRGA